MGKKKVHRADFLEYHRSLAAELEAVKNRVKNLTPHRATRGSFKEAALRSVLRRHLPDSLQIGTGFIVNKRQECSTQIDLLIVDSSHPTLFRDGDLLIVTPSAVKGIIETKSELSGKSKLTKAYRKLAQCKLLCIEWPSFQDIFTGLYVYDAANNQELNILKAAKAVYEAKMGHVDAVAYGPDQIASPQTLKLDGDKKSRGECVVWNTPNLAPAYFISLILNKLNRFEMIINPLAWSPGQPENRPLAYIDAETGEPTVFEESESTS